MDTPIPSWLNHILEFFVGQKWPTGSEGGMRAHSGEWEKLKNTLSTAQSSLEAEKRNVPDAMSGSFADGVTKSIADLIDNIKELNGSVDKMRKDLKNGAAELQETKIMIVVQLALLAIQLAWLMASLFGALAIPAVVAGFRAIIWAIMRGVFVEVAQELLEEPVLKMLIEAVQDGAGTREGIDWNGVRQAAIASAIAAAAAGFAHGATAPAIEKLVKKWAKPDKLGADGTIFIKNDWGARAGQIFASGAVQAGVAIPAEMAGQAATGAPIEARWGTATSAFVSGLHESNSLPHEYLNQMDLAFRGFDEASPPLSEGADGVPEGEDEKVAPPEGEDAPPEDDEKNPMRGAGLSRDTSGHGDTSGFRDDSSDSDGVSSIGDDEKFFDGDSDVSDDDAPLLGRGADHGTVLFGQSSAGSNSAFNAGSGHGSEGSRGAAAGGRGGHESAGGFGGRGQAGAGRTDGLGSEFGSGSGRGAVRTGGEPETISTVGGEHLGSGHSGFGDVPTSTNNGQGEDTGRDAERAEGQGGSGRDQQDHGGDQDRGHDQSRFRDTGLDHGQDQDRGDGQGLDHGQDHDQQRDEGRGRDGDQDQDQSRNQQGDQSRGQGLGQDQSRGHNDGQDNGRGNAEPEGRERDQSDGPVHKDTTNSVQDGRADLDSRQNQTGDQNQTGNQNQTDTPPHGELLEHLSPSTSQQGADSGNTGSIPDQRSAADPQQSTVDQHSIDNGSHSGIDPNQSGDGQTQNGPQAPAQGQAASPATQASSPASNVPASSSPQASHASSTPPAGPASSSPPASPASSQAVSPAPAPNNSTGTQTTPSNTGSVQQATPPASQPDARPATESRPIDPVPPPSPRTADAATPLDVTSNERPPARTEQVVPAPEQVTPPAPDSRRDNAAPDPAPSSRTDSSPDSTPGTGHTDRSDSGRDSSPAAKSTDTSRPAPQRQPESRDSPQHIDQPRPQIKQVGGQDVARPADLTASKSQDSGQDPNRFFRPPVKTESGNNPQQPVHTHRGSDRDGSERHGDAGYVFAPIDVDALMGNNEAGHSEVADGPRPQLSPLPDANTPLSAVPVPLVAKPTDQTQTAGDPIDVTTGRMIYTEIDAVLPGLTLERTHRSDYNWGRSFGRTWASTLDQRLVTDGTHARFLAADGSIRTYPMPAEGEETLPLLGRPDPLRRLIGGGWLIVEPDRWLLFAAAADGDDSLLSDLLARDVRWTIERDDDGTPAALSSSSRDFLVLDSTAGLVTGARIMRSGGAGEVPSLVDLAGFEYDERRNLVGVRNASGEMARLHYDDAGRIAGWADRNGEYYAYVYDESGRCVQAGGKGGYLQYSFEYFDGVTLVTDSLGGVHRYELSDRLQITAVVDPLGAVTRLEWDERNQPVSRTDPLGRVTRFTGGGDTPVVQEYDEREWTYDGEGNPVEGVDALGGVVRFEYGPFDMPIARVDENGHRTTYAYDTELRLSEVTNPAGQVWRYAYDPAGRLTAETDFDGRTHRYTHDAAGQLIAHTNAAGDTTHYTYDGHGRVIERRSGETVTRLGYDEDGRLSAVESPDALILFERDEQGRIVAETINGRTVRTSYHHGLDAVEELVLPSGRSSRWGLDPAGRPTTLETGGHRIRFVLDAAGREIQRTVDDAVALRQRFDAAGRLVHQHVADTTELAYSYDAVDRVTAIGHRSFAADGSGRIRSVTSAGEQSERYDYDEAGNLAAAGAGRWRFDGTMLVRSDDAEFEYDERGRLVGRTDTAGDWRFVWDAEDRLVEAATPGGDHWRYRYDGFGRRIAKQRLGSDRALVEEVRFTWSGDLMVEQSHSGAAGTVTTSWEYRPDGSAPVTQTDDDALRTVITDLVGTPTHLVDAGGALQWWSRSDLWGRTREPAAIPLRFPGQYFDAETGFHYNRFRYYDPATGRYLSPDPLGLSGGPNPTAYVRDPLTLADPLGLASCKPLPSPLSPPPARGPDPDGPSPLPIRSQSPSPEALHGASPRPRHHTPGGALAVPPRTFAGQSIDSVQAAMADHAGSTQVTATDSRSLADRVAALNGDPDAQAQVLETFRHNLVKTVTASNGNTIPVLAKNVHGETANTEADLNTLAENDFSWVRPFNGDPNYQNNKNCPDLTLAVDEFLESGRVRSVPPSSTPKPPEAVEAAKPGRKFVQLDNSQELTDAFDAMPKGSKAILGMWRPDLSQGHLITVIRHESGAVSILDSQASDGPLGTLMKIDGDGKYYFMPTGNLPGVDTNVGEADGSSDAQADGPADVQSDVAYDSSGDVIMGGLPQSGLFSTPSFDNVSDATVSKSTAETTLQGDPIDVTTGRMIMTYTDITLPGLTLERTHRSDYAWGRSFGRSWASTLDQRVIVDGDVVRFLAADGSVLTYPLPAEGAEALPKIGRALPLLRLVGGGWVLTDPTSGRELVFAPATGSASLLSHISGSGTHWTIDRDPFGTPIGLRSSARGEVEFSSSHGLITTMWLPSSGGAMMHAGDFGYDAEFNLVRVTNSSSDAERYEYADGRIVRWDDRNGEWYEYLYDEAGRCVSTDGGDGYLRYQFDYQPGRTVVTDSLGVVRTYELNDRLQVVVETDGLGGVTRTEWDDAYRMRSQTDPLGRTTRYEYGPDGQQTAHIRADGSRSTIAYDDFGRAVEWTGFDGRTSRREFDADGRIVAERGADGSVVRSARPTEDGAGTTVQLGASSLILDAERRVSSIRTGDTETSYTYDTLGRVVAAENADGVILQGWTLEGDLAWREHSDGSLEQFFYDGEGNLVEVIDRAGRTTLREYGAFDLLTAEIDGDGNRTEYDYDTELRLRRITNAAGETWLYTYDVNGRIVAETDFGGRTQRYAYDAAGQLIEHTDAAGQVHHFTYDLLGRVIERRTGDAVTRLAYDPAGRVVEARDEDSEILIERDALGRVVSETVNGNTVSTTYNEQFGAVNALTRPSGTVTQWSYDESGRPQVLVAGGHQLQIGYSDGREVSRAWDAGLAIQPSTETDPEPITTGEARYTLDATGRPVTRTAAAGDWHFAWDHDSRLIGVATPDGDRWHYRYDAFGRRTAKQRLGAKGAVLEEFVFVWSGDLLVEQHRRSGRGKATTTAWEYHPSIAHPIAQVVNGAVQAMVTDGAGAPRDVVGIDGKRGGDDTPLRAAGRYFDAETGLLYDRSRYFDPATGRFLPEPRTAPAPAT